MASLVTMIMPMASIIGFNVLNTFSSTNIQTWQIKVADNATLEPWWKLLESISRLS